MNLLDRHIFKSALFYCATAVGLCAFVLMVGNFVRDLLGAALSGQIGTFTLIRLVLLLIPFVVSYALPMGILAGVLLTLGQLSADNEITAMRAAGMSVRRIARPLFILGAAGAITGLFVNFESMPWARVAYAQELAAAVRANPLGLIVPKTFIRSFPGYVFYIGEKNGEDLKDVWVWQLDEDRRVVRFSRAQSGRIGYDEASNAFIVVLHNGKVEARDEKAPEDFSQPPSVPSFEYMDPLHLPLDRLFGRNEVHTKPQWLTYGQLQAERARVAREPVPPGGAKEHARSMMKLAMIFQDKWTTALAVLSFTLIGIPIGIRVSRRETSANLALAVALALGYYFLTVMIGWLDQHPEYRPDLLLWLPDLIFIAIGLWLLRRFDHA